MEYQKITRRVDELMDSHKNGSAVIADSFSFSTYKTIQYITLYIMSKYLGGMIDPVTGKRLRFKNIGNGIVDIEFRAKNIDQKAIVATAIDGDTVFSMIVNRELQNWMRNNFFGETIDNYQRKKSEYGNVLLKKTVKKDEDGKRVLCIEPVQWTQMMVEHKDIAGGMKVEDYEMSELDLQKKRKFWIRENVDEVLEKYSRNSVLGEKIKVLDIEGEFPASWFTGNSEDTDVKLYNVICAEVLSQKTILYWNEIESSSYMFDRRKVVEQRGWGVGVWEELFEPQIAINEASIAEADAMDLAGKVVIKTNKKTNIPNALALVNGEMISMEDGEYMETMSLTPGALPMWQNMMSDWFLNAQRDQSAYGSISGSGGEKANTPFSSLALQAAQAGSIFNKRRDADGYFLSKVLMNWVLPFIIEKINKGHELVGAYSPMELKLIDKSIKDTVLDEYKLEELSKGHLPSPIQMDSISNDLDEQLSLMGGTRKINIPKNYLTLDKIKKKIRFDITGEMSDSQAELNALATRLQSLPPEDPARMQIINQISEVAGISPTSFYSKPSTGSPQKQNQQMSQSVAQNPDKIQKLLPLAQR